MNANALMTINGVRVNLAQGGAVGGTFGTTQGLSVINNNNNNIISSNTQTSRTITQTSVSSLYESY